ncbi:MAG: hypothetical protein HKL88_00775 [Bacteroidia bacterium]|nr:hypothetical protein [Bacteroidia bacterium]
MNSRIYIFLLLASLTTCSIHSQSLKWSPYCDETSKFELRRMVYCDDSGVYIFRKQVQNPYLDFRAMDDLFRNGVSKLEEYDFKGNKIFSKDIVCSGMGGLNRRFFTVDLLRMKKNLVAVLQDGEHDTICLAALTKKGNICSQMVKFAPADDCFDQFLQSSNSGPTTFCDFYHWTTSYDSTSLLTYYLPKNENKIVMKCYNENLNLIWAKSAEVNFKGKDLNYIKGVFNGKVVVFLVHSKHAKKKDPEYSLLVVNPYTGTVTQKGLDLKTGDINYTYNNFHLTTNKAGDVFFLAPYDAHFADFVNGTYKDFYETVGLYYARIDKDSNNVSILKKLPFPKKMVLPFITANTPSYTGGIDDFGIVAIYPNEDNSLLFGCGQYNTEKFTSGPVIFGKINSGGSIEWTKLVVKEQEKYPSSCLMNYLDKNLVLLFYDSRKYTTEELSDTSQVQNPEQKNSGGKSLFLNLASLDLSTLKFTATSFPLTTSIDNPKPALPLRFLLSMEDRGYIVVQYARSEISRSGNIRELFSLGFLDLR